MKALKEYVDQKNFWNSFTKQPQLVIGRDNQKIAYLIDNELSPENLTCDGELTASQVRAKLRILTETANDLKKLDPSVKFYELS